MDPITLTMNPEIILWIKLISILIIVSYCFYLLFDFIFGMSISKWRVKQKDDRWVIQCGAVLTPFWDDYCHGTIMGDCFHTFSYDKEREAIMKMIEFQKDHR